MVEAWASKVVGLRLVIDLKIFFVTFLRYYDIYLNFDLGLDSGLDLVRTQPVTSVSMVYSIMHTPTFEGNHRMFAYSKQNL